LHINYLDLVTNQTQILTIMLQQIGLHYSKTDTSVAQADCFY